MQNLPLDAKQYLQQRWQGQFQSRDASALGPGVFQQLVRIQLPPSYTRLWAVNMAPVLGPGGAFWDTGADPADGPLTSGTLQMRWGTMGQAESVELDA